MTTESYLLFVFSIICQYKASLCLPICVHPHAYCIYACMHPSIHLRNKRHASVLTDYILLTLYYTFCFHINLFDLNSNRLLDDIDVQLQEWNKEHKGIVGKYPTYDEVI